jgi:2-oxoglutarate dehydrogenase E1 component
VQKIIDDRKLMGEGKLPVDWGMGENLAYASLVAAGFAVRISGEDVGRGTFFHRHAALHDQNREKWDEGTYWPLQHVQEKQGRFMCFDSVLSEEAVLAFDYGYATASPNELVIWEGQFGDFANGAQVVIDQFLSSGEAKWGRGCGLVMLLPHGYEGQGPEHSSARLERYMQLSAEFNWEVCVPSNAAQIFHMLRRQMLRKQRKPLIVMTPKSLLRHKDATCSIDDLVNGTFQTIIGETEKLDAKKVTRLVTCAGKVYFDLLAARREQKIDNVALVRVEQLYPFDDRRLAEEMKKYPNLKELIWCQEEPLNQGAWYAKHHRLSELVKKGQTLDVVARPASASPAVGYAAKHTLQQKAVINAALGIKE